MSVHGGVHSLYMALHIADPEVSDLVTELAHRDHTTKTEALRRLLQREIADRRLREQREGFDALAAQIIQQARAQHFAPVIKDEMDDLWDQ